MRPKHAHGFRRTRGNPSGGAAISRVQTQNLEHSVYQKLKQDLDSQIADVLQTRFMPDIAGALDQALHKISDDLKANINAMVRASIEDTLQAQLKQLRLGRRRTADRRRARQRPV